MLWILPPRRTFRRLCNIFRKDVRLCPLLIAFRCVAPSCSSCHLVLTLTSYHLDYLFGRFVRVDDCSWLYLSIELTFLRSVRILVLKDGQVIERGTHSELIALDGSFAAMWADQVSSSDAASSHKKEPVTGYSVGQDEDADTKAETEGATEETPVVAQEPAAEEAPAVTEEAAPAPFPVTEEATPAPVSFPTTEEAAAPEAPEADKAAPVSFPTSEETAAPVAFPSEDAPVTPPVAFPTSESGTPFAFPSSESPVPAPVSFPGGGEETASQNTPSLADRAGTPGVTFQNVPTPPRTGTPDMNQDDGKRRRTLSTQGIQRLARRISISGRRQGSTAGSIIANAIPILRRENTTASHRDSKDDGSARPSVEGASVGLGITDSPAPSIVQSEGTQTPSKIKKKEKKEAKRKSTIL